jgi:preprotein translocase subunit SecG
MFQFLLVVHLIIAVAMTVVILMQRSEGGGLTGGSPGGLMSARGAADFLTRTTTILAILFVGLSIALAAIATMKRAPTNIDTSLQKKKGALDATATAPTASNAVTPPVVPLAVPTTGTATPSAAAPVAAPPKVVIEKPVAVERRPVAPDRRVDQAQDREAPAAQTQPAQRETIVRPIARPSTPAPIEPRPTQVKVPEGLIPPTNPQ